MADFGEREIEYKKSNIKSSKKMIQKNDIKKVKLERKLFKKFYQKVQILYFVRYNRIAYVKNRRLA